MTEMSQYELGYRDGMEHITSQVNYINDQVLRLTNLLTKAVFTQPAKTPPRPNMHIWLVLGEDMLTTGYFIGGKYVSDSGFEVEPTYWCMIPSVISGDSPGPLKRIIKQ